MSRSVKLGSDPSSRQLLFLNCMARRQLYGGAKRGGKSVAICMKGIMLSVLFPGNRGAFFRQDLTDLRDSLLVTFFQICPRELVLEHHQTFKRIVIDTGSTPSVILYGGLGDASDIESAKGKEFGWYAIDEPSEVDRDAVRMLNAQLCWRLPDGSFPPYMELLASNPEPGWVEEEFRPLIEESSDVKPLVLTDDGSKAFVRALPRDNPYLPPGWETMQRIDAPDAWVKKYLEGSWEVSEGQVFKEFQREVHCIGLPPAAYLSRLKLIASVDHATTGVTCMVVAGVDPDNNVVVLGEYYQKNKLISEHSRGMFALMDEWVDRCGQRAKVQQAEPQPGVHPAYHAFEYVLIDPSTQSKTLQSRDELTSVQDEYRRMGLPTTTAWNAVEAGVNLLAEYLHIKPTHIHPLTQQRGAPSILFLRDSNPNGIREIISWRKTIGENGKPKYIGPDHWVDNVRYIVMSRPEPPRVTTGDMRGTGDAQTDTITRMAMRDMLKFDQKHRDPAARASQWFPGGSDGSNIWFPRTD
jgi:hypothetical protein